MLFSCRNPFSRGALAAAAVALLLAGCGGGGGGDSTARSDVGLAPSSSLAGICTLEGQKSFVRSYLNEVYLWYDEIPAVNPADYNSVQAYMSALLVRTPDATGLPKDRFSAVLTTEGADALQASALAGQRIEQARKEAPAPTLLSGHLPGGSVPLAKTVTSQGGRNVGYVLFNDHHEGAQDALITAFENLRSAAIQDLVLDLRYNSGGYLYVAQTAASMVTSSQNAGRVFEQLRYNNKREAESRAGVFRFTSTVQTMETTYPRGHALPQLSLPRVYVLSSDLTCSASESIVNGLRGIDVQVILVGESTCGKPYGFQRKDNCGLAFFPIEFQGYNEKGFGDYTTGFAPTCAVADDGQTALGATNEPLLEAALVHVDTGACPPGTAVSGNRLPQSVDLRGGGRSSAASPVGGRLVLRPKDR
jgi:carboxyl-terminal processing protease